MFHAEQDQEKNIGRLHISREVVMTVVRQAALEVPGVHALTRIPVDVKTCIQLKGIPSEIAVDLSDTTAVIELALVVEGGYKLNAVAENVQSAVKEAVQSMAGVAVSKVNVIVDGVHFVKEATQQA